MHQSAPLIGRSIFIVLEEFKKGDREMSKLEKCREELERANVRMIEDPYSIRDVFSCLTDKEFEEVIKEMFFQGEIKANNEVIITNMRHKEALMDAENSLQMVMRSLRDHMPEDFYSIDLMSAYASLGYIIGEEVEEDLVNEIFSKFCMGK